MYYQRLIHELDPGANPAGVEAPMRLRHRALNHLSREEFKDKIRTARQCEKEKRGHTREAQDTRTDSVNTRAAPAAGGKSWNTSPQSASR